MRTSKGHGARGDDAVATGGQRASSPGKHTLTEAISPVQRKPGDPGRVANLAATTIATGGLSENDLRAEHGLTLRHGHTRP